jgi:hypothetical protein
MGLVRRRYRRSFGLLVGIVLAAMALHGGAAGANEKASVSAFIRDNGSGGMIANSQTNPAGETWSWEVCSTDLSNCDPFAQGRVVSTGGARPGVVFRATSNSGVSGLSPLWRGRVTPMQPPSIEGIVRANELVVPVAGTWRGGWKGSENWLQLAACSTPSGRNCTTLTDMHFVESCPNWAAVLDPFFTGNYLRVASKRVAPGTGVLAYAVTAPYGQPVWERNRQTSVAVLGQIAAASGARTEPCGAAPLDSLPLPDHPFGPSAAK